MPWHRDARREPVRSVLGSALAARRRVIRPLHDRILAQASREETKTSGGLFIPDTAKEKPLEAKVIAVGAASARQGRQDPARSTVKAGDKVLFGKYTGTEVKIDGEEHLILREDDILAVLD